VNVPFFRPDLGDAEIDEVVDTLRSGWLSTGPRVRRFEEDLAAAVGATHAVAVNSCTAALHLAVEALGLRRGQAVLVPTMTFAATAEVVRYSGALPVLVDCDPVTLNMDLEDAERKLAELEAGRLAPLQGNGEVEAVGVMPVHVGGLMMDMGAVRAFAARHGGAADARRRTPRAIGRNGARRSRRGVAAAHASRWDGRRRPVSAFVHRAVRRGVAARASSG